MANIPTCNVLCNVYDNDGTPIVGAKVTAKLNNIEIYNGYVIPDIVSATTNADGFCTLALWPNQLGATESSYDVKIISPNGKTARVVATVPNVASASLHLISNVPPYEGKSDGQLIVDAAIAAVAPAVAAQNAASASATAANASAAAASASAVSASGSAATATTKSSEASSSATTASTQASNASSSATLAQDWATKTSSEVVVGQGFGAKKYATDAATSATTATTSATNASTSATSAGTSATTATTKATEAASSAANALSSANTATTGAATATTQATNASSSATTANTKATEATNSASSASSSASSASTSANNASNSASTATTQAGIATTQAVNAATSATTSTSQASNASGSASAASTSATNAATSATNAATSATNASNSATTATTQAGIATTQAGIATTQAANANTQAANAVASAASALSIYGSVTAQQSAVSTATSQASLAASYATAAGSAVQQDLSGVTAQVLHRSPNAINSMFIYDTSKDSDGGAWTEKCQHTSWYNEALNGSWLGPRDSEIHARSTNATYGSALVTGDNSSFTSSLGSWYGATGLAYNASTGTLRGSFTAQYNAGYIQLALPTVTAGNYYRVRAKVTFSSNVSSQVKVTVLNGPSSYGPSGIDIFNNSSFAATTNTTINVDGVFLAVTPLSGTSNHLQLYYATGAGSSVSATVDFDDVFVEQITAFKTNSGDYYQLATDGKFYRLWKNLNNNSTISPPSNSVIAITPNAGVSFDGTNTATLATAIAATSNSSSAWHSYLVGTNAVGMTHSFYIKHVSGDGLVYGQKGSGDGFEFNCNTGAFITQDSRHAYSIVPAANGYFRVSIQALSGSGSSLFVTPKTLNNSFLISGFQTEYGTVSAFEAKVATSSISETFRGNKRDFPRLAGIVAEATSVTIYDLTEAGRPMWMRFNANTANTQIYGNVATLTTFNGLASVGTNGGISQLNFPKDNADLFRIGNQGLDYKYRRLALRNDATGALLSNASKTPAIANNTVNAVAMTVLPDAPVDPVTSLKVPTIAVATEGGISVIKQDGTVVNITGQANAQKTIAFDKKNNIVSTGYGWNEVFTTPIPSASINISSTGRRYGIGNTPYIGLSNPTKAVAGKDFKLFGYSNYVSFLLESPKRYASGLVSSISNTFNTGYLIGDIRRAYLADTDVGSVSGTELAANANQFVAGAQPAYLVINSATSFSYTQQGADWKGLSWAIPAAVQGRSLLLSFTLSGSNTGLYIGTASGTWNVISGSGSTGVFKLVVPAIAGTTSLVLAFQQAAVVDVTNWSVKEFVSDRSYKAALAPLTGTLTKTQVASSAQLVAYSNFSAANYLREPYSADLDFGTGEWNCGAWVNVSTPGGNLALYSEQFDNAAGWTNYSPGGFPSMVVIPNSLAAPNLEVTADKLINSTVQGFHYITSASFVSTGLYTFSIYAKAGELQYLYIREAPTGVRAAFNLTTGEKFPITSYDTQILDVGNGWYRCCVTFNYTGSTAIQILTADISGFSGDGTSGIYLWGAQITKGVGFAPYVATTSSVVVANSSIATRGHSSGPYFNLCMNSYGFLTATAFDGTTTRTVTTTATYNTATWLKAEANYTTDGTLGITVNGAEVAATRGNPLLTLNNSSAVLTIGNNFATDAPFPGSIALLKLSATVPTPEQSVWMYEQEKQLFRDGAQCCLPDSGSIVDLSYDDATDKWISVSATNRSEFTGLVRTGVTASPVGSYTKVSATSGVQLQARSTSIPGVDVTIPPYGLREELVNRSEAASRLNADLVTFDYVGGFTASTTNGNTAITSVASLTYPTSYIGAQVTGSGIPASTVIVAVSGTTIYLSKAATATATSVQISFTDFILPVGYEEKVVLTAGASKVEGATKDFTKLFDGFKETVRFGTAPGYNVAVQVQASRSK